MKSEQPSFLFANIFTNERWIWKMPIFQFHWISHQGTKFGFHGQRILTSFFAYVSPWEQFHKFSRKCWKYQCLYQGWKNIWIVIFLDHMFTVGKPMEESLMSRDTAIFLLQHLGFVLNLEKSILNPVQKTELLGVKINSLRCVWLYHK